MERVSKRLYMREHSNVIRKFQSIKLLDKMEENPIFNIEGTNRLIIVTICRIRQRMLTQAWRILTRNTGVKHDYEFDAKVILSRKLPDEELRTELEIEILFKWIYVTKDIDPTGIANTIFLCKKRSAIYNALQQLRLEFYEPGETVLFQGDIPRHEDGHFTIFNGVCEVLQFPEDSMPLMKLLYLAKKKKWDDARKLLNQAIVLARINKASGFGELSTLTGVKRAATIRVDPNSVGAAEIVVLPKTALLDCLKSRRNDGVEGAAPSEAMDFMRQSGLANRISPKDLVRVAQSMVRRTLLQGEILFYRGETVKSLFLVVSGELLLDTGDFMVDGTPQAFINSNPDNCFHMSSGSILGDEGVTGQSNYFESTAVVVSDAAVVFEAVEFGMTFLTEKIGALRYCALTYRDKSRWSAPIHLAEEINPYTYFHSLRKAIAYTHPYRGSRPNIYSEHPDSSNSHNATTATTTLASSSSSSKLRRGTVNRSEKHKPPQSNVKKLSPLVRMNSNLAYMMTAEQDTNPAPVVEFNFPRQLKPVGLHHALDINRTAKKLAQKFVKVHAQENILYDQMTKHLMQAAPGREQREAEAKFKSHIAEYRDRAAKHAAQVQREMERERISKAHAANASAVKFYGSLSPENSVDSREALGNTRRRGFSRDAEGSHGSDLDDVVQSKPFSSGHLHLQRSGGSAQAGQHHLGQLHTGSADDEHSVSVDAHLRMHLHDAEALAESAKKELNVTDIERALHDALMLSDIDQLRTSATGAGEEAAEYEDANYFKRPKIVQYFIWMDHLNRHTYRSLLHAAQQTIDANMSRPHDTKLALTDKTMEELTNIFNRFGLTPTDMNIPWRPGSPKTGIAHFDDGSDDEEPPAPGVEAIAASAPASPIVVPVLELPKVQVQAEEHKVIDEKDWGRKDKEKERNMALIKVQGKFKTYHPASWRHEIIMKKEKGIVKENFHLFTRSTTPDNRRICGRYYHYPGQHHPDFVHAGHEGQGGRRPHSRPGSRPMTGHKEHLQTHTEEQLETESTVERRVAREERIADLQAHFSTVPAKFMEAVKSVNLSQRREHLPNNEWSTRFMRSAVEAPPGDSASSAKAERVRNFQATRSIPSDSYSKATLLKNAKTILDSNNKKYMLTDSTMILQASMQGGMLQTMKSVRNLRSSFLSQSAGAGGNGSSGARMMSLASALPSEAQLTRETRGMSADTTSTASRSPDSSVGHLSADEDLTQQDGAEEEGEEGEAQEESNDGDDHVNSERETVGGDQEGADRLGATRAVHGGDKHNMHDKQDKIGQTSPAAVLTSRTGVGADDQSVGNNSIIAALGQRVMSPYAPAPSHIDKSVFSGESVEAQLDSLASPSGTAVFSLLSPVYTPHAPLESQASQNSFGEPTTPQGHHSASKAADPAALRMKELREKITAQAPSDAMELFNNYMKTDNNPRKFYEGKKKAGANSKYGLASSHKLAKGDVSKPSAAEIELLGIRKASVSSDLALFNSLFPGSSEEQRKEFVDNSRLQRLAELNGTAARTADGAAMQVGGGGGQSLLPRKLGEGTVRMSVKDLRIEPAAAMESRSRAVSRTMQELEDSSPRSRLLSAEECAELDLDPDVVVWQNFTLDIMHREKTGPKKILPVLIMKNEGGASSRRFAVNKSKRWGSGVLLQLASQAEEDPIDGPPTYLEIFKGTQRRKLREKDRKRITDDLHALIK